MKSYPIRSLSVTLNMSVGISFVCVVLLLYSIYYEIVPPGRKSGFRVGFRPDASRESLKIGPLASRRPAGGPLLRFPHQNPAESRPGSPISGPEALLRDIGFAGALGRGDLYSLFRAGLAPPSPTWLSLDVTPRLLSIGQLSYRLH
jgi:hypothetical protein